jgi:hypothetical protein
MIGSWFPLPRSPHGSWGWEVVASDGETVASGTATTEDAASWDCRIALAGQRMAVGAAAADVALLPSPTRFGGRWAEPLPA